ncbi:ferrochelatase [Helicobacter cappadocius]|uniref:Ferrochelatase n=1 Tax=Helicobacter cappadocius TaxID=3063998 RepID=A0AA90PS72_9HELI|nr:MULTISPECIES: ferrochelatase [unclassified Helicobacter]MDO7253248.1 ferrochelatase [Helicobacter sp. faydin-H75]MDP2539172.1 ferrochelatase [Helicobacter sp. faydin-H76]
MPKEAVLLLNMGGPSSLYEVEGFLTNMFYDPHILSIRNSFFRKMIANFIVSKRSEKSKKIYSAIGGKSPITEITFSLTQKLQQMDESRLYTYVMRYTPPYSKMVLEDLKNKGIKSLVLISMYPQYSKTTTLSSITDIYDSLKDLDYHPDIRIIDRFYANPAFSQAVLEDIKKSLNGKDSTEFTLILSAHGIPESVVKRGDAYQKECEENFEIIKNKLQEQGIIFKDIFLSYQSKVGPMKWIGPDTDQIIQKCKKSKIIIYPISFTIDNSETKYELSIQYKQLAQEIGIKDYIVCPCLNDSDLFAKMILQYAQPNRKD